MSGLRKHEDVRRSGPSRSWSSAYTPRQQAIEHTRQTPSVHIDRHVWCHIRRQIRMITTAYVLFVNATREDLTQQLTSLLDRPSTRPSSGELTQQVATATFPSSYDVDEPTLSHPTGALHHLNSPTATFTSTRNSVARQLHKGEAPSMDLLAVSPTIVLSVHPPYNQAEFKCPESMFSLQSHHSEFS